MKPLKYILTVFACITILFSFQTITDQSMVFALGDAVCCDDGLCENSNPGYTTRCSSTASGRVKSACDEISMTCRKCVDYTYSSCICYGGGSDFCMQADESLYYGNYTECDISK